MIYTKDKTLLTRTHLRAIPVPVRPNVGPNWEGVQHGHLADVVVDEIERLGFEISNETWFTSPSKTALFGSVDVVTKGTQFDLDIGQDSQFSLGVRHDNGGRYAISLAVGARVTVCSNGLFTGDFVLKNRHSKNIMLEDLVSYGIEEWLSSTSEVERFAKLLRSTELDDRDASYLISKAGTRLGFGGDQLMSWEKGGFVLQHWMKPPYEEFQERTAWSLYNAFTHVGKELSPPYQMHLLKGLKPMMEKFISNN